MWLQLLPFEPVLVLNFQFVHIKGILYGCKLLAVLEWPLVLMAIKICWSYQSRIQHMSLRSYWSLWSKAYLQHTYYALAKAKLHIS